MRFRLMALVVAILGVFGPVGIAPSAWAAPEENPDSSRDSLLFIGMSGIRPSDIDFSSRELSRLLSLYSFAALSPRSVSPLTCPSEGGCSYVPHVTSQIAFQNLLLWLWETSVIRRGSLKIQPRSMTLTRKLSTFAILRSVSGNRMARTVLVFG